MSGIGLVIVELLTTAGYLLGGLLAFVAGVLALKATRKLASCLLMVGGGMVVLEMSFWLVDEVISLMRTGDTYSGGIGENFYDMVAWVGVVGTMLAGAGVVALALYFRALLSENARLQGLAQVGRA